MPKCLGIYIENNRIKFAKVSKTEDIIDIETIGSKFYTDDFKETIYDIIEETSSYKDIIAINLNDEKYEYLYLPETNKKNKKELENKFEKIFSDICLEKDINISEIKNRLRILDVEEDGNKKAVEIYIENEKFNNIFDKLKNINIDAAFPIPIAIEKLLKLEDKENSIIVNIENKTFISTIINGEVTNINFDENGMEEIIENINLREFSYKKSYEIYRNILLPLDSDNSIYEENEDLKIIIPVLYNIINKLTEIVEKAKEKPKKIYITGTGATIGNIEIYFGEYFPEIECQILKPLGADKEKQINVREYIEVNSSIAIALQGLDEKKQDINFLKKDKIAKKELTQKEKKETKGIAYEINKINSQKLNKEMGVTLDKQKVLWTTWAIAIILITIIFSVFSIYLSEQMNEKIKKAEIRIKDVNSQIEKIENDIKKLETIIQGYGGLVNNLKDTSSKVKLINQYRNAITTFLNQLAYNVPEGVKINEIKTIEGKKILLEVETTQYDKLGYFITQLKLEGILTSVASGKSEDDGEKIKTTIEGVLP